MAYLLISLLISAASAFPVVPHQQIFTSSRKSSTTTPTAPATTSLLQVTRDSDVGDDISILFEDEEGDDEEDNDEDYYSEDTTTSPSKKKKNNNRWENMNPQVKQRLIKRGQERAIQNKEKREPIHQKKRRIMMFVKEQQQEKKRQAKVSRPKSIHDAERISLAELAAKVDEEIQGTVISLTPFGAYVDVGSERDGLLHISQLSQETFVEHPRQLLSPGDVIPVRIRSVNPDLQKLHLTMLPLDVLQQERQEQEQSEDRIPLSELASDDELWGQLKRVTDFGAYVEVGAQVDGWLHFMDHPSWEVGMHPSEFMTVGDRVRVWVADVDTTTPQKSRLKLTAVRPGHLPGPRREIM